MKAAKPAVIEREFPTNYNIAIDVAPLIPRCPRNWPFWLAFQWQPAVGRWMGHIGREAQFKCLTHAQFKALIREAGGLGLCIAALHLSPAQRSQ